MCSFAMPEFLIEALTFETRTDHIKNSRSCC